MLLRKAACRVQLVLPGQSGLRRTVSAHRGEQLSAPPRSAIAPFGVLIGACTRLPFCSVAIRTGSGPHVCQQRYPIRVQAASMATRDVLKIEAALSLGFWRCVLNKARTTRVLGSLCQISTSSKDGTSRCKRMERLQSRLLRVRPSAFGIGRTVRAVAR